MRYPHMPHADDVPTLTKRAIFEDAYVFEKLDGGNVRVEVREDVIRYGLRSGHMRGNRAPWKDRFSKWYWTNRDAIQELPPGIYFGEFLAPHTIKYKDEFVDQFFLIDVHDGSNFLPYSKGLELAADVPVIRPAPLLHRGQVTDGLVEELIDGKSAFSVTGDREGIVIKNYTLQSFVKVKHPKFKDNPALPDDCEEEELEQRLSIS